MVDVAALLIAGGILVCAIALFVLWLIASNTKRRVKALEDKHKE